VTTCTEPGCTNKHLAKGLCRKHYDLRPERATRRREATSKWQRTPKARATRGRREKAKREAANLKKYGSKVHPYYLPSVCPHCGGEALPGKRVAGMCGACYSNKRYHTDDRYRQQLKDHSRRWAKGNPAEKAEMTLRAGKLRGKRMRGTEPPFPRTIRSWTPEGLQRQVAPLVSDGDCFEVAFLYMLDLKDADEIRKTRLCHGYVQGTKHPFRHTHAWIEVTEQMPVQSGVRAHAITLVMVIDRANGHDITLPRDYYYQLGKIDSDQVERYGRPAAQVQAATYSTYGPWDAQMLKYATIPSQKGGAAS
jgi:hypothetical protein